MRSGHAISADGLRSISPRPDPRSEGLDPSAGVSSFEHRASISINAIVLLPEHLHAIWTLPPGDDNYPMRWGWIKKEFTKEWLAAGGIEQPVSPARRERGDRGIWQPRYWEHTSEDEHDFDRHFDYIHYNPRKLGHVKCPRDWPHSSIHRWIEAGVYDADWGSAEDRPLNFDDLDESAMELGIK